MQKQIIFSSLVFFQALAYTDEAPPEYSAFGWGIVSPLQKTAAATPSTPKENAEKECSTSLRSPDPMHAGVRHIEGKGIGYNQGYTTLELFLSPDVAQCKMLPFLDLRGHVFDNGQFAFNTGIGFRYRGDHRSYGANAFYDYRQTHRRNYGQIGLGLESLGTFWDFRINGYLPIGKTDSHWFSPKFSKFEGHNLFIQRKQEFAMRGLDAEVGYHFLTKVKTWDLYTAAGPYYFEGKGKNTYGGKLRLGTLWKNFISLEASGSYDNIFHGIVQGQIGFRVPFGPKSTTKDKCNSSRTRKLMDRMVQPVVRDEIIVTTKRHKDFIARNSETGEPLFFWFVNNLSHSAGTFESPFPTLSEALTRSKSGDIIYIYPGDGTTTGLNAGLAAFQLQDNQQLWGTGIPYSIQTQFGHVRIPILASGRPQLTASDNVPVITVANNNTISGLSLTSHINTGSHYCLGALGTSVNNLTVTDNLITASSSGFLSSMAGIECDTFSGSLILSNNDITYSTTTAIYGVLMGAQDTTASFLVTNNRFTGLSSSGLGVRLYSTSTMAGTTYASSNVSSNIFVGGDRGLDLEVGLNQNLYTHVVQNNRFTDTTTGIYVTTNAASNGKFIINSNNFENSTTAVNMTANSTCLTFQNNTSDNGGYSFAYLTGFPFNVEPFVGNTPEPTLNGAITIVPAGFCGN